ncbi:MAG: protein kinase [Pirellulales bacterium]
MGRSTHCPACKREITIGDTTSETPPGKPSSNRGSGETLPSVSGNHDTRVTSERIGRFEIKQQLGAGAFGEVYRAYDRTLDREVALKVPKATTVSSTRAMDRFLREAKAAAQLRHPHIVPVYDAGQTDGRYYIASAFINGQPLSDLIADEPLDSHRAATVVRALAEALAYAHEQGVIHRDIKPDNVMVDQSGQPHIMDFGLARFQESTDKVTQDGTVLGTAAYMAPEQARGELDQVGPASDQYSLGVVLYELLTGQTPFSGPPQVVLFNVLESEPPPPRSLRTDLPLDLETICLRAMAKEAGQRYANCAELADDLRRFLENEPIAARRLRPAERLVRWCRRNPAVAGLTVAVFAVLALGVVASSLFAVQSARRAIVAQREAKRADDEMQAAQAAKAGLEEKAEELRQAEAKAIAEARRAEGEAKLARQAESRLDAEAKAARAAESKAEAEAQAAREAESRADAEAARARERAYYVSMLLAQNEWERNNMPRFLGLLASQRPASPDQDPRGFEWFYWWDQAHRGHGTRIWEGASSPARAVFSPDGTRIIYGASDGTIHVCDARTRRPVVHMEGAGGSGQSLQIMSLSPDGDTLAALITGNSVKAWDTATGRQRFSATARAKHVRQLLFSPDSRQLMAVSEFWRDDKQPRDWGAEIELWNANTGKFNRKTELKDALGTLAFSADGKRIFAAGRSPEIMVFEEKGKLQRTVQGLRPTVMAVSPAKKRLAIGLGDGSIRVLDDGTLEEVCVLRGHARNVFELAFSPDGNLLISRGAEGAIRVWDCGSRDPVYRAWGGGRQTHELRMHSDGVQSFCLKPDGEQVVALGSRRIEETWDLANTPKTLVVDGHGAVAFSRDGRWLAAGAYGPPVDNVRSPGLSVKIWDAATGEERWWLKGHTSRIACVAFSPDGSLVASGGHDKLVKIWDTVTGQEVCTYRAHQAAVKQLAFSQDGTRIASSEDAQVRVWNPKTADDIRAFPDRGAQAISSDGKWLDNKGILHTGGIWNEQSADEELNLGNRLIGMAAFSPDGKLVAADIGQGIKIWDAQTGNEIALCLGNSYVQSMAFSPDGRRLACSGGDDVARLWDTATGQDILVINRNYDHPDNTPGSIGFSPDGHRLAVVQGSHLYLFDAPEAVEPVANTLPWPPR